MELEFIDLAGLPVDESYGMTEIGLTTLNPPSGENRIGFARQRIGYKAPEEMVILDAMPLNITGKVDRMILKQMAEARLTKAAGG